MPAASRRHSATRLSLPADSALERRSTNATLAVGLVAEACALEVSASQAGEVGIAAAAARRRQECWLAESQDALASSNVFVEQHGLPLAQYRHF